MRNPLDHLITQEEVINHLKSHVEFEDMYAEALVVAGNLEPLLARTALAVIQAASTIIKNDPYSEAAKLLDQAFNSENVLIKEIA